MKRTKIPMALAAAAALALLAGCQPNRWDSSDRNNVEIGGKTVTVIDNPEKTAYDSSEVNALVRLDGVRGMDWLSDESVVVERENLGVEPTVIENVSWYPHNLYIRELGSGSETAIAPGDVNQGFALANPGKTRIYYQTLALQSSTGQGNVYDFATGASRSFTKEDALAFDGGRWIDNDTLLYSTIEGGIYKLSTDTLVSAKLADSGEMFPGNLAYIDGKTYYTTLKGKLNIVAEDGTSRASAMDGVVWMVPSPDEQRLAVVSRIGGGETMELTIADLNGNVQQAVAQDSQIYGVAWSPDGSKLAYAGITSNGTVRGIYVADSATGLSKAQSLDVKFISDPLKWNPSGNRLMVGSTVPDERQTRNRFVTYLVRVDS